MAKKSQYYDGRSIAQAVKEQYPDANVRKNGSYIEVERNGSREYIPDTARDLPKPVRESVMSVLAKMGIILGIILLMMLLAALAAV